MEASRISYKITRVDGCRSELFLKTQTPGFRDQHVARLHQGAPANLDIYVSTLVDGLFQAPTTVPSAYHRVIDLDTGHSDSDGLKIGHLVEPARGELARRTLWASTRQRSTTLGPRL